MITNPFNAFQYSNATITKVYVSEYPDEGLEVNYNSDYQITGFTSTGGWYYIDMNTASASYTTNFEKTQNGLLFNEQLSISIPKQDNTKWNELTQFFDIKYLIIFKDSNDLYWCMGYKNGVYLKQYELVENQYIITFISPMTTNMLTSITEAYVNTI